MAVQAADLGVSRETFSRLSVFALLLEQWNPRINLVSRASLPHVWDRHIADSLQVLRHLPDGARHWADLGSGGGFPGLVAAIVLPETAPALRVTLVESDARKAVFLRHVLRQTSVAATVLQERIETLAPLNADVISARALSDLTTLLEYMNRHAVARGIGLFPKGKTWAAEVDSARKRWDFAVDAVTSVTEPAAVILKIEGLRRV